MGYNIGWPAPEIAARERNPYLFTREQEHLPYDAHSPRRNFTSTQAIRKEVLSCRIERSPAGTASRNSPSRKASSSSTLSAASRSRSAARTADASERWTVTRKA